MVENVDVVVIGAGIAGLVAARSLTGRHRTVVLEARPRVGGRLLGTVHAETGEPIELGGAYVAVNRQPAMRDLIAQTATPMRPRANGATPTFLLNGQAHAISALPSDVLLDLERLLFRLMEAAELFDPRLSLAQQQLDSLDIPFRDFLQAETGPTTASALVEAFFTQLAGARADVISATWPVGLIAWRGKSILAMLTSEVMQFEHGTSDFVGRLAADLDLRLGCPVVSVEDRDDDVRVELADGSSIHARAAVLAVPVNALRDIALTPRLPIALDAYVRRGHPGAGQKMWLRAQGLSAAVTVTTTDPRMLHITTDRLVDGISHLVAFGLAQALDASDVEAVREALRAALPAAELLDVSFHDWTADPWSQGTWMVHRPAEYTTVGELSRTRGRLVFAGSDVADSWAGNMEGAAQSGMRAADAVDESLAVDR